jgi:hypothetical protein
MSDSSGRLDGILIPAESISEDGEVTSYAQFVVTLEEDSIDIRRLGQRKDTVWMLDLGKVEEALRVLKRWKA